MQENVCPQCDKNVLPPLNRLIQDSCGHKKCRYCFLDDELRCKQCEILNGVNNPKFVTLERDSTPVTASLINNHKVDDTNHNSVVENPAKLTTLNSVPFENHTAVIQCNGTPKVSLDKVGYHNKIKKPSEDAIVKQESLISNTDHKPPVIQRDAKPPDAKNSHLNSVFKTPIPKGFKTAFKDKLKQKAIKKEPNSHIQSKLKKRKALEIPDHITLGFEPLSFHCNLCNKSFKTKGHVKYHKFCTGENRPHTCSLCGKDFILKAQLELHLIKHREEKPLSCEICQKSFYEMSKLKRHMQIHTDEKKFMCTECGKTYRTREALYIHLSIHKGEKLFRCNLCAAKFNNSSNLKRHFVTHTAKELHMCDLCGKKFKLKWALKVHRKSHSRIRDFKCEVCLKTFILNKELQRHLKTHDDSTVYTCSLCHTSFRRRDNLYRHTKNTHPGKKVDVLVEKKKTDRSESVAVKEDRVANSTPAVVVDNPNAIKVITASPAFVKSKTLSVAVPRDESNVDIVDSRTVCRTPAAAGCNGPPKLALKGSDFKMHYNIKRDCDYIHPTQVPNPINLSESVDICHKIMSPSTDYTCPTSPNIDERTSTEICQKILCVDVPGHDESAVVLEQSLVTRQTSEYEYEFEHRIKIEQGPQESDRISKETIDLITPSSDHSDRITNLTNTTCPSPTQEILGIQAPIPINLSESVNIYQKIMSPSTDYTDPTRNIDDQTFKENCKRILSPPTEISPVPVPIPLSESVNIYQRIMSPSTDYTDPTRQVDDEIFKENCQRILLPPPDILPPLVPIQRSKTANIHEKIMSPSKEYTNSNKNMKDLTFICEKILPPSPVLPSPVPLHLPVNVNEDISSNHVNFTKSTNETTSNENCQKNLSMSSGEPPPNQLSNNFLLSVPNTGPLQGMSSPFSRYSSSPRSDFSQYSSPGASPRPGLPQYSNTLHYSSSFQNQKHALIKSIKFKVPQEYTRIFKQQQSHRDDSAKSVQKHASVIVNNSNVTQ